MNPTVLRDVTVERDYQDNKWGAIPTLPEGRPTAIWLEILMEEVGESCEASLKHGFGDGARQAIYNEWVQIAAVGLAACEHMRLNWPELGEYSRKGAPLDRDGSGDE